MGLLNSNSNNFFMKCILTSIAFSQCFKICNKKDYDYHNLHLNNYLFHFDFQDERSSFYFFGYTAYVYIKIRNLFSLATG